MTKAIAEDRNHAARRVPVEGVAIGVYGASGTPQTGAPAASSPEHFRRKKEGLLYRELSYGRGHADLPLETGLGLGNSPPRGATA
jgi:hypothetical protein